MKMKLYAREWAELTQAGSSGSMNWAKKEEEKEWEMEESFLLLTESWQYAFMARLYGERRKPSVWWCSVNAITLDY